MTEKQKKSFEVVENYIKEDLCGSFDEELSVRMEGDCGVIVITGGKRWEVGIDMNDYHFGLISLYGEEIWDDDLDTIMELKDNRRDIIDIFNVEMGYDDILNDDQNLSGSLKTVKEKNPNCNLVDEVGKYVWTAIVGEWSMKNWKGMKYLVSDWCEKHYDEIKKRIEMFNSLNNN